MIQARARNAAVVRGLIGMIVCLACCACMPAGKQPSGPVLVALRYDDYCGPPQSGPDEDLVMERELFAACHRVGLVPTVAVIPDTQNLDGRPVVPLSAPASRVRVALLRRLIARGEIEMAQHGYRHDYLVRQALWPVGSPPRTEFAGAAPELQRQRIQAGRAVLMLLLGRAPDIFVPPNNTYDAGTVQALAESGFSVLSGSVFGGVAPASGLAFVPETTAFDDFEAAVNNAARYPGPSVVIAMLHPFRVQHGKYRDGPTVAEIEATLRRIKSVAGVQFTTIGQIAAQHPRLVTAAHLRAAAPTRWAFVSRSLGPITHRVLAGRVANVYWPEGVYRRIQWILWLPAAAGALIGLLGAVLLTGLLRRCLETPAVHAVLGVLALLGTVASVKWALALLTFQAGPFGPRLQVIVAAVATGSLLLGLLLLSRLRRGRTPRLSRGLTSGT